MYYLKKMSFVIMFLLVVSISNSQEKDLNTDLNYLLGTNNYKVDKIDNSYVISIYPNYEVKINGDVVTADIAVDIISNIKVFLKSKYPALDFKIIQFSKLPFTFEKELSRKMILKNVLIISLALVIFLFAFIITLGLYKYRYRLIQLENLIFKKADMSEILFKYIEANKIDSLIMQISNYNFKRILNYYKPEILYENKLLFFYSYRFEYKSIILTTSYSKKILHNNIIKFNFIKNQMNVK